MDRKKNFYLYFWLGLVMLVVGLFFISQNVVVSNSMWYSGINLMGMRINSGLIVVPLIASIIWVIVKPGKGSTAAVILSLVIMIAALIQSTRFYIRYISLFDWLVMLVFVFGGLALMGKSFLTKS